MEDQCSTLPLPSASTAQCAKVLPARHTNVGRPLVALESGMWLLGCTYNFCWPHHELSRRAAKAQGKAGGLLLTKSLASGLIDHVWSIQELLSYRVAPLYWIEPKRRGRPKKLAGA